MPRWALQSCSHGSMSTARKVMLYGVALGDRPSPPAPLAHAAGQAKAVEEASPQLCVGAQN
eukprot:877136-Alexandrium_andersonii.AAC.1